MKKLFSYISIFLIFSFTALALDKNIPKTESEWEKAVESLTWKEGPLKLNFNQANSTIDISSNFLVLEEKDAQQYLYWANGTEFNYIKFYATNSDRAQYMFFYEPSGYVKNDDWTDVHPEKFLKQIIKNYKVSNQDRERNGQPIVLSASWKKKPYLDGVHNSVYYALNVKWSDNTSTVEGTALILGREGYTTAKYVEGESGYQEQMLLNLSKMHKFNATKEYKDWKSGDKVAAVGIGALLATTLGVKALKPGIIAGLLLLLKKFWFIIFLPFIWLGKLFTGSSTKKKR